jgi:starch phosphorylase
MKPSARHHVAYFSMEFAVDAAIPNFAGGLGVLAADILHSCADMSEPVVGVSLIYHQSNNPKHAFDPEKFMKKRPETTIITIEDREVKIGCYEYTIETPHGKPIPIIFLTTNFEENKRWDRDLTKHLYADHGYTRIGAEAILGIGGVRMLRALGYDNIKTFHMNEGHAAFMTFELLRETGYSDAEVKKLSTFTTHTPIPAGHDYFGYEDVHNVVRDEMPWHIRKLATEERLSMTHLALNLSHHSNSVSEKHREVCEGMFPGYKFENITNGVHHLTWTSPHMAKLFDKYLKGWREDPSVFKDAETKLPDDELMKAHLANKKEYCAWINGQRDAFAVKGELQEEDLFEEDVLTLTFARRMVQYKRPELIFLHLDRLREVGYKKLQLVFAGRCHPNNHYCINIRESIMKYAERLRGQIRVAVIQDYEIDIAKKLVSGSDVWLNNPIKPLEASGTSGMKAALNGLPNLSIPDGWWDEGYKMKPLAGWVFGERSEGVADPKVRDHLDSTELYDRLEEIVPEYEKDKTKWAKRMKASIALLEHFNTHRVVDEYYDKMWKTD